MSESMSGSKRERSESAESSDDEGFGPSAELFQGGRAANLESTEGTKSTKSTKKQKQKQKQKQWPTRELDINKTYANSYMHLDHVTALAEYDSVLVSGSKDGVIKLWTVAKDTVVQKDTEPDQRQSLDFIREFKTNGAVKAFAVNHRDATLACITASEKCVRIFDLKSFDLTSIIHLSFEPGVVCLAYFQQDPVVVVTENDSAVIHVVSIDEGEDVVKTDSVHASNVVAMEYNAKYNCVISTDEKGMIEYWVPGDDFKKPEGIFETKMKTNLYDIRKSKSSVKSLVVSAGGEQFITASSPDDKIRVFDFKQGKLVEEFHAKVSGGLAVDKSGSFVIYADDAGIQLRNLLSGATRTVGAGENLRFAGAALLEPLLDRLTIEMASSVSNEFISKKLKKRGKMLLVALSRSNNRFFVFDNGETEVDSTERDVHNERASDVVSKSSSALASRVTVHTNLGDLVLKLYPDRAPVAVENFVKLCSRGYYNAVIFHRIIPGFMVQTGDPTGTGTGGESVYGHEFKDEFDGALRHFKYALSMANAGPNTNGSQFFIVTSAKQLTHLDDKHTVFGKVVEGTEVVDEIEKVPTDDEDRPSAMVPKIISTTVDV